METPLESYLLVNRALSDPARVRALFALEGRELCLCQLCELLGLAASTVSRHMALLRQADLVEARKEGRWAWFRTASTERSPAAAAARERAFELLARDPVLRADRRALRRILRTTPEELCARR